MVDHPRFFLGMDRLCATVQLVRIEWRNAPLGPLDRLARPDHGVDGHLVGAPEITKQLTSASLRNNRLTLTIGGAGHGQQAGEAGEDP
jgi:hypothetical protein